MKKLELNVNGMHCHSCEMLITDSLLEERGVKKATAEFKRNKVTIEFDETVVSEKRLNEIIKNEGYGVS